MLEKKKQNKKQTFLYLLDVYIIISWIESILYIPLIDLSKKKKKKIKKKWLKKGLGDKKKQKKLQPYAFLDFFKKGVMRN